MAINIQDPDHRMRLSKALRRSYNDTYRQRLLRRNLVRIFEDDASGYGLFDIDSDKNDLGTLVNYFQKYVRGHLLSLAYYAPVWDINARTKAGRGFDKRIQALLGRYAELLNFNVVQKQLALDSAFGWAVCKIDSGIAPKGVTAPVAPRTYRVDPDLFIPDRSAATFDECSYLADMYLVPLAEAKLYPGFNPEKAAELTEYRVSTGSARPDQLTTDELFSEPMVRLIDVYIPKQGSIYTWNSPNDEFTMIPQEPLGERKSSINPYSVLSLLTVPGKLSEISRLGALRGLHLLSNEMFMKGVEQARNSQRNPTAPLGSEMSLDAALSAGDGNAIYTAPDAQIGTFVIPGPDPSILNLATAAGAMFSSEAGNLEVALGASTGADTARQTEALLGQISASQSIDRRSFEMFLAEIGKKIATLAFESDVLQLETIGRVPGLRMEYSRLWDSPENLPRVAEIDSFHFDVAPRSTSFRTPQERLNQLQQASQLMLQWMQVAAEGAPVNMQAIMATASEAYDLVPELEEWWNGDPPPNAAERTSNTYRSLAAPPQGSDVRVTRTSEGGQQEGAPPPQAAGGPEAPQ